jgi:hypothetical protein
MSNACIKGLPNLPTKLPVMKPSFRPSQIADIIVYPTAGQSISPTTLNGVLYASNHFYAHSKSQYRSHYKPIPSASPSNAPTTTLTPSVQVEFQSLQAQQHQCNNIKVFNQNLCPWGPKLLSIFKFCQYWQYVYYV